MSLIPIDLRMAQDHQQALRKIRQQQYLSQQFVTSSKAKTLIGLDLAGLVLVVLLTIVSRL